MLRVQRNEVRELQPGSGLQRGQKHGRTGRRREPVRGGPRLIPAFTRRAAVTLLGLTGDDTGPALVQRLPAGKWGICGSSGP